MENINSNAEVINFGNDGKSNEKYIVCPLCNKGIKENILEEHARRIHGKNFALHKALAAERLEKPKAKTPAKAKKSRARKALAKKIRAEKAKICKERVVDRIVERKTLDGSIVQNKQILEYLIKNPCDNGMGKFGVPQDKYRHGFYGNKTMEYDALRKCDKEKYD